MKRRKYTKSKIVELRIAGMKHRGKASLRKLKREHGKKELCKMQEKVEISLESFETGWVSDSICNLGIKRLPH